MLLKMIGSFTILGASALLGYVMSRDFSLRPHQLRELQTSFQMLENEIVFMSNVLKDALSNICINNSSKTSVVFKDAAALLENGNLNASEAWNTALDKNIARTALDSEDHKILSSFGKMLGTSDFEGQIRNIRLIITQLKVQEEKAEESKKKNESMYRNLGILGGLALVIILV